MGNIKSFENLRIRKEAKVLVKEVYTDFKNCRDFGFCDQIQRAAVSIMNNSAEGFERRSDADFARFLDIAKGSSAQARSMYYTPTDLDYVPEETTKKRQTRATNISFGIGALTKHLGKKESRP